MLERIPDFLLVGLGGIFGAMARYWIAGILRDYKSIPIGTMTVNVLGSFFLAFLITLNQFRLFNTTWIIIIGIGFLGSFTTMSTFVVETMKLTNLSMKIAITNLISTIVLVFAGGYVGQFVALIYIKGRLNIWN